MPTYPYATSSSRNPLVALLASLFSSAPSAAPVASRDRAGRILAHAFFAVLLLTLFLVYFSTTNASSRDPTGGGAGWAAATAGGGSGGPGEGEGELESDSARARRERAEANVVRVNRLSGGIPGSDGRGWIMSPMHAAAEHGLAGARSCVDVHVGTIGPGKSRANHRHHTKNESFLVWGANASWRIENPSLPSGYAEVTIDATDVAVLTAPAGRGHALANTDSDRTLILCVCADTEWDPEHPDTDYKVWKDL